MKRYQLNVAPNGNADGLLPAVSAIGRVARSPEFARAVAAGHEARGDAFLAFVTLPGTTQVRDSEALDAFDITYCLTADSLPYAVRMLLDFNGWQKQIDALYAELGTDRFLSWDESRLLEALEKRYTFVPTPNAYHVFDVEALERFLDR